MLFPGYRGRIPCPVCWTKTDLLYLPLRKPLKPNPSTCDQSRDPNIHMSVGRNPRHHIIFVSAPDTLPTRKPRKPSDSYVNVLSTCDKKFIKNFKKLSEMITKDMENAQSNNQKMLCGGCGSKVGNVILESSLRKLSDHSSKHIVSKIGDDAAIIKFNSSFQALTTDHLRSFTKDVWLQSKITAIHALGDIWAMGSDPEIALTNIIIPDSSNDIQKRTIEEIIDGANSVFGAEGVKIVGGHTSLGKELVIGFTLGGLSKNQPKTVDRASVGDQIILTKPLGSGVLLAGEMRFEGEGQDLKNLFDAMSKSQSSIANVLRKVANSMTDITGFGLGGHLLNIVSKSNVGAKLYLDQIPVYPGAKNLIAKDIRSSIFENNYIRIMGK